MMRYHTIAPDAFDSLSRVTADPEVAAFLRKVRLSRTLLLIRHIALSLDDEPAVAALAAAQTADAAAFERVMAYPWVGVWAARYVRSSADDGDRAHLSAVAGAAALRAGVPEAVPLLSVRPGGTIALPTLGAFVGERHPRRVAPADLTGTSWLPVRHVRLPCTDGGEWALATDDVDPYRDCHGSAAAERLDGPTWDTWTEMLRRAWDVIAEHTPLRALEIEAGLSAVTPLSSSGSRGGDSATNGDAFGGFAMSLVDDPYSVAATMIHEFQHSRLNALTDLVTLVDGTSADLYFAPWRRDARPLEALIHGIFAFIAVAQMWQAVRHVPTVEEAATRHFALIRAQLSRAARPLPLASGLTAAGRRLVAGLAAAVEELADHDVPPAVHRDAVRAVDAAEHRLSTTQVRLPA
ncbi:aKG-HExxH-type peptide beta-hydroxylase [Catellatospora chokoriensis]|uniref:HEXXH motif domain-containing protein n=1 Tax=Catellatospora chokoriensis TaxID=310353 RepID=A0A8J3KAR8_9ACTN|nr:HEXXH motif-containing putative peptide modification protein [Catellatospora chokoriensis]GIF93228.1 HEXXH motif domain-containing protein [Catellatospora chokoriensis]